MYHKGHGGEFQNPTVQHPGTIGTESVRRLWTRTYLVDPRSLGHRNRNYEVVKVKIYRALILNIDKRVRSTRTWPAINGQGERGFILRLHFSNVCVLSV